MTADTIYYLGSTVAQTLASLAGFLGAFVLFYLQGNERSLIDYGKQFAGRQGFQAATDSLLAGDFDRFEELLQGYLKDYASSGQINVRDRIERELAEFHKRRAGRRLAIAQFKWAVIVTAPVLLVSLVLIEFAPAIACRASLPWILTFVLIAGAAACGWLYWTVISACVGRG